MATINSITFNAGSTGTDGSYNTGDPIAATVNWVPDTAPVVAQSFTLSASVVNSGGTTTATDSAPFTVNVSVSAGDVIQASSTDASGASDGRVWAVGAPALNSDGSVTTVVSTTA
jgi:hypothetical protein